MRHIEEYEIVCKGENSEISFYSKFYTRDHDDRLPEKTAESPTDELLKLFNDCNMLKWDGFHGPNPRHIRDGYMFTLKAELNGGVKIYADGSNNYPRHYRELLDTLRDILHSN